MLLETVGVFVLARLCLHTSMSPEGRLGARERYVAQDDINGISLRMVPGGICIGIRPQRAGAGVGGRASHERLREPLLAWCSWRLTLPLTLTPVLSILPRPQGAARAVAAA